MSCFTSEVVSRRTLINLTASWFHLILLIHFLIEQQGRIGRISPEVFQPDKSRLGVTKIEFNLNLFLKHSNVSNSQRLYQDGHLDILSEYVTNNSGKQIMLASVFKKFTRCVLNFSNTKTIFFGNKTPFVSSFFARTKYLQLLNYCFDWK